MRVAVPRVMRAEQGGVDRSTAVGITLDVS